MPPQARPTRAAPDRSCAEQLAGECVRLRSELRRTGMVLHDEIGSLLAVAGLRLQLAKMDHPDATPSLAEIAEALEGVVGHVRKLSRDVERSPVRRTGLKNALLDLAEASMEHSGVDVSVHYSITATVQHEAAEALYLATAAVVRDAMSRKGVRRVAIRASGAKKVTVRVSHDLRIAGMPAGLQATALLARAAGLSFEVRSGGPETKHGTIVAINYAL
jgi:signal transduction histidine kinase